MEYVVLTVGVLKSEISHVHLENVQSEYDWTNQCPLKGREAIFSSDEPGSYQSEFPLFHCSTVISSTGGQL